MTNCDHNTKLVNEVLELTGRPNRATDRSRKAVHLAVLAAHEFGSPAIDSRHLLCGLVREECGVACHIVSELGLKGETLDQILAVRQTVDINFTPTLDDDLSLPMSDSWTAATSLGHNYIGTEHLLLGIVASQTRALELLTQLGIDGKTIAANIRKLIQPKGCGGPELDYPLSVFKYVFQDLVKAPHLRISIPESTTLWLSQLCGTTQQTSLPQLEKLLRNQEHKRILYLLLRIMLPSDASDTLDDLERSENLKNEFVNKQQFEDAAKWLYKRNSAFSALSQYVNGESTVLPSHIERLFELLAGDPLPPERKA